MANENKYLDLNGVSKLWTAITKHDADTLVSAQQAIKNLTLSYDSDARKIILGGTGAETPVSIDASAFVKDGMVSNVEVITTSDSVVIDGISDGTKFIKFTWNTDTPSENGEPKVSYLKVSDFAKTYAGTDSIEINESNEIYVKQVEADITKVSKSIPVAGGPLSDLLVSAGITEIKEGTDFQTLLKDLFCKELWPNSLSSTEGDVVSTITAPTFTFPDVTTMEVGSVCEMGKVTISAAAQPSSTLPVVSGFEYGYSSTNDNSQDSEDTSITGSLISESLENEDYSLVFSCENFVYAEGDDKGKTVSIDTVSDSNYNNITYAGLKLAVEPGDNKLIVTANGPRAKATFAAMPEYYACSNIMNTSNDHKSTSLAEHTITSTNGASKSKSYTVTGKYKYFIGSYSDSVFNEKEYTSTSIRTTDCEKSGYMNNTSISYEIKVPAGTKGMYIAIPADVDSTGATLDVKQKTNSNNPVNEEMVANKKTINLTCAGTATKDYNIFTWSFPGGTAGEEIFTISKF